MLYFSKNAPFHHLQQSVQLVYQSHRCLKERSCPPWGPGLFLPVPWWHNPGLFCQGERESQVVQSILGMEVPSQTKSSWYDLRLGCSFYRWSAVGSWWASHTPVLTDYMFCLRLFCSLFLMCILLTWKRGCREKRVKQTLTAFGSFGNTLWPGVMTVCSSSRRIWRFWVCKCWAVNGTELRWCNCLDLYLKRKYSEPRRPVGWGEQTQNTKSTENNLPGKKLWFC